MMHWNQLHHACHTCTKCNLSDHRQGTVVGAGNPNGKILFVGDAPDLFESQQNLPFVGPTNGILQDFLSIIHLSPQRNIYLTHIIKCCPPSSRPVLHTERSCCLAYLRNQVLLLKPKIIVCLGETVAQHLINDDFDLSRHRGIFYEKADTQLVGFFHPSDLIQDPRQKPFMLEDCKKLEQKIKEICPETYKF